MSVMDRVPQFPSTYTPTTPLSFGGFPSRPTSVLQVGTRTMGMMCLPLPHWIQEPGSGDSLETAKRSVLGIEVTGERTPAGADGSTRACTTTKSPWAAGEGGG